MSSRPDFWTIIRFGTITFPIALLALPVYVYLPAVYTQEIGMNVALVGSILLATRIFDGFSDPLIGWLSDRTGGRFGRRRPWVALSVPVMVTSAYFLFVPPDDAGLSYLILWGFAFTIGWTALTLPLEAWAAELTGDYNGRTRVFAGRQVFALLGTMVAAALPVFMISMGIEDIRSHMEVLAVLIAFTLPLTAILILSTVDEPRSLTRKRLQGLSGFFSPLGNRDFRRLLTSFFLNSVANGLPVSLFILFVTHRIGMPEIYGQLLFAYFLAGLVGIPFWAWVAKLTSKHRAWSIAMIWACAAFFTTPFVVGQGDADIFLIITILSGLGVGADLAIPASVLADVVDEDTHRTGEERTGFFFALWGLGAKIALGFAVAFAFIPLDLVGFESEAGAENSQLALTTLAWLYAGLPVALKLIAISFMWNFPLNKERQHAIRTEIEARATKR